jgi:hypothetical protein
MAKGGRWAEGLLSRPDAAGAKIQTSVPACPSTSVMDLGEALPVEVAVSCRLAARAVNRVVVFVMLCAPGHGWCGRV